MKKNYYLDYAVVILFAVVTLLQSWSFLAVIITCALVWLVLNPIDPKIFARLGITAIILAGFFLIVGNQKVAEELASATYFLLAASVLTVARNYLFAGSE